MRISTTIVAALSLLSAVMCPTVMANPVPDMQGRDFRGRFAPVARPVFPRKYYDNTTISKRSTAKVHRWEGRAVLTLEPREPAPQPDATVKRRHDPIEERAIEARIPFATGTGLPYLRKKP